MTWRYRDFRRHIAAARIRDHDGDELQLEHWVLYGTPSMALGVLWACMDKGRDANLNTEKAEA